jgi:hypothetical protein
MAHDVFVSYSSYDKATADAVCALLEARGIRCWIAPRDILPGVSWAEAIIDAIEASRVMVLVFSARANASQQIQREVERAVHNGVTIVPLRIEDAKPSKTMEYFISTPHWLDALTPPLESHIQRLADGLRTLLSRPDVRQEVSASVKMRAALMGQAGAAPAPAATPEAPARPRMDAVPPAPPAAASAPAAQPEVPPAPPPVSQVPVARLAPPSPVGPPPAPAAPAWAAPAATPVRAEPEAAPSHGLAAPPAPPAPPAAQPPAPVRATPAPAPAPAAGVGVPAPPAAPAQGLAQRLGLSNLQLGAAAGVVLLVVAMVAGALIRRSPAPPSGPAAPAETTETAAPAATPSTAASAPAAVPGESTAPSPAPAAPAATLATVTLDAAPWARVSIAPVGGGTAPPGELVTPLLVQLPPGEYDVTLDNAGLTQALTQRIRVSADQPNAFRFTMPGFAPARVVQDLRATEVRP